MKAFDTPHHQDYYKNWIYLATINGEDYYFQGLPSETDPFPSISIVYGVEPHEYISTTFSVADMLDDQKVISLIKLYMEHNYYPMIHLITLIRQFAANNKKGV